MKNKYLALKRPIALRNRDQTGRIKSLLLKPLEPGRLIDMHVHVNQAQALARNTIDNDGNAPLIGDLILLDIDAALREAFRANFPWPADIAA